MGGLTAERPDPPIVELDAVDKRFGGAHALRGVDLTIEAGTVHALIGENGAGKSTAGKIVAGVHRPDGGCVRVAGRTVHFRSPRDAIAAGVTIVEQEISLVPTRSVVENVFLGMERTRCGLIGRRATERRFRELCDRAGFFVAPHVLTGCLPIGQQQKVELLRALARDAKVIVMDEPTAALSADESTHLAQIVRALRARGTAIVFISHFLREVLEIADVVTVMRDGQVVRSGPAYDETEANLVTAMLGRPLEAAFPTRTRPAHDAPIRLAVRHLSRGEAVRDVSFHVRAGEIVGLAGLVGSGRSEIARAVFGADRGAEGEVEIDGRRFAPQSPLHAKRRGLAFLPESRKDHGLLMSRPVAENMSLAHLDLVSPGGLVWHGQEARTLKTLARSVSLSVTRLRTPVMTLSGGNQQKAMFAKWLMRAPRTLIVDEPTRGVDVGAKRAIYDVIHGLARNGVAILLISSELEEILGLAHRVLVVGRGRIVAEIDGQEATEELIMRAAFGAEEVAVP